MAKSKSSASSFVVASIFVIYFLNGVEFLKATCVAWSPIIVTLPLTKM